MTIILILTAVGIAIAAIAEPICSWLATIIKAVGEAGARIITARGEAKVEIIDAKSRSNLLAEAAKHPDSIDVYRELLKLQPANANLRNGRRMEDEYLVRALGQSKPRGKSPSELQPGGGAPAGAPDVRVIRLQQPPSKLLSLRHPLNGVGGSRLYLATICGSGLLVELLLPVTAHRCEPPRVLKPVLGRSAPALRYFQRLLWAD